MKHLVDLIFESNLINFLMVLIPLIWFVGKKLPELSKARKTEIQEELIKAQEAKKDAEQKLEELQKEIKNAKYESIKIVEQAKENAEAMKAQVLIEAKQEVVRLNANALKEIEMHKTMAINTIKEQLTNLTMKNVEETLQAKRAELDKIIKAKLGQDLKGQTVKG